MHMSASPQKKRKGRYESDSEMSFDDDYSGSAESLTDIDFPSDNDVSDNQDVLEDLDVSEWDD